MGCGASTASIATNHKQIAPGGVMSAERERLALRVDELEVQLAACSANPYHAAGASAAASGTLLNHDPATASGTALPLRLSELVAGLEQEFSLELSAGLAEGLGIDDADEDIASRLLLLQDSGKDMIERFCLPRIRECAALCHASNSKFLPIFVSW